MCDSCPIALALLGVLKNLYSVDVASESVGVWDYNGNMVHSLPLPEIANKFIEAFDAEPRADGRESALSPFEFELSIDAVHLR